MQISIKNKINLDFDKVGDIEIIDGITRFVSITADVINIPEGVYLIVRNGEISYVGKFSSGSGRKKMNFGSRWLYVSRVISYMNKSAYEIYHHIETNKQHLSKSISNGDNVEVFVLSEDKLMTIVDNHPLVNVDSTEIAILKEFNLLDFGWNEKR